MGKIKDLKGLVDLAAPRAAGFRPPVSAARERCDTLFVIADALDGRRGLCYLPSRGSAGVWTKGQPEATEKGTKMRRTTRKSRLWLAVIALVTAELSTGCQSSTGTGALAGGALGAGI